MLSRTVKLSLGFASPLKMKEMSPLSHLMSEKSTRVVSKRMFAPLFASTRFGLRSSICSRDCCRNFLTSEETMDKYAVDLDQVLNDFEYSELTDQYSNASARAPTGSAPSPVQNNVTKHSINNVFHSLNEYLNTNINVNTINPVDNNFLRDVECGDETQASNVVGSSQKSIIEKCNPKTDLLVDLNGEINENKKFLNEEVSLPKETSDNIEIEDNCTEKPVESIEQVENTDESIEKVETAVESNGKNEDKTSENISQGSENSKLESYVLKSVTGGLLEKAKEDIPEIKSEDTLKAAEDNALEAVVDSSLEDAQGSKEEVREIDKKDDCVEKEEANEDVGNETKINEVNAEQLAEREQIEPEQEEFGEEKEPKVETEAEQEEFPEENEVKVGFSEELDLDDSEISKLLEELENEDIEINEEKESQVDNEIGDTVEIEKGTKDQIGDVTITEAVYEDTPESSTNKNERNAECTKNDSTIIEEALKEKVPKENKVLPNIGAGDACSEEKSLPKSEEEVNIKESVDRIEENKEVKECVAENLVEEKIVAPDSNPAEIQKETSQDSLSRPQNLPLVAEGEEPKRKINLIGDPGSTPYNNVYINKEIPKSKGTEYDSDTDYSTSSSPTFSDASTTASTASIDEVQNPINPVPLEESSIPAEPKDKSHTMSDNPTSIESKNADPTILPDTDNPSLKSENPTPETDNPTSETENQTSEMDNAASEMENPASDGPLPASQDGEASESVPGASVQNVDSANPFALGKQWLGKEAPLWVPDSVALSCLHCDMKFTVLKRRHHCRACGLVLCSKCCHLRFRLEYLDAEARVCNKCHDILNKDTNSSSGSDMSPDQGNSPSHRPNPNNPLEYCSDGVTPAAGKRGQL
ncbi:hypothetical protein NQ318_001956 [Aromia moschata]|uniref:FYVE-type domain-containing protein n=1 Tax=Aromia moschata TaxID=1265417 RepID=A0AAV8Z2S4_9CUCU|nr:hypothetical protein NQ318_001956 [Aromia moschata]